MANREPATGTAADVVDLKKRVKVLEEQVLALRTAAGLLTYAEKQAAVKALVK